MDTPMDLTRKKKRCTDWSKLCPDVLRKIFESFLSPIDQHQSKTVCLDWYSVWKTCVNRPPFPYRYIHQGNDPPRLFNPVGDNIHTIKYFGQDSHMYHRMASSGSWLFMIDFRLDFYLLNLVTLERINLPSMDSPISGGQVSFEKGRGGIHDWGYGCFVGPSRSDEVSKEILEWKSPAVLWIDETTGDYAVAWIVRQLYLFSYKKGDDSWTNLKPLGTNTSGFRDLACENKNLYVLTTDQEIKIFDFSQEVIDKNPYWNRPFRFEEKPWQFVWKRKIAIDKSGQVLIILSLKEVKYDEEKLLFYVFKMNLESCKWERVESIGDNEMLIFGHGVTVKAPVKDCGDGIKSGVIRFVDDDVWPDHKDHEERASDCGVFDLATSRIEWPKKLRFYINKTQWFVPGVAY